MWRQRYGIPAPPVWPLAVTFTGSLVVAAGSAILCRPPAVGLAALATVTAIASWCAPARLAPGSALIAWLFDDGFVEHRLGTLGFHLGSDVPAMAVLGLAALLGSELGRHGRAASRRRQEEEPACKRGVKDELGWRSRADA